MPPTMYLHWLLGVSSVAACFSYYLVHPSKVGRRLEIRFSVSGLAAPNPKQSRKFHSRGRKGQRVKRIGDINERTRLMAFCGLRKQRESQACPTGGSRAAQFHEGPAGKSAAEERIEFRDAGRLEFYCGAILKSFQSSTDETCFEFSVLPGESNHSFVRIRLLFAYA
jgi:hypothetical protein